MTSEHSAAISHLKALLPDEVNLHVGMTKAGSTAIQNAFAKNAGFLLSHGVFFPTSIVGRPNPLFPARTSGHLRFFSGLDGLESLTAEASVSGPTARKVFFSSENVFLDLEPEAYARVRELFLGKSLRLFCILRAQPDWLRSRYFESVVKGFKREAAPFEDFVYRLLSAGQLDYAQRLDDLQGLLGASEVIAVDYDAVMDNGGSVRAALENLGIVGELPHALSADESNISHPSAEAIEAQRQLNRLTAGLTPDQYKAWGARMEAAGADLRTSASPLTMPPALLHRVVQACREPNERLSARYLGGASFGRRDAAAPDHKTAPDGAQVGRLLETGIDALAPLVADAAAESAERLREIERLLRQGRGVRQAMALTVSSLERQGGELESTLDALKGDLRLVSRELEREKSNAGVLRKQLGDLETKSEARDGAPKDTQSALKISHKKLVQIRKDLRRARDEMTRTGNEQIGIKPRPLKFAFDSVVARLDATRKNAVSKAERSALLADADLFDAGWYLSRYPDVAASKSDPLTHYLRFGAAEGRDPSQVFSTRKYLSKYPDVAATAINPLVHYFRYGKHEGRRPVSPEDDLPTPTRHKSEKSRRSRSRSAIAAESRSADNVRRVALSIVEMAATSKYEELFKLKRKLEPEISKEESFLLYHFANIALCNKVSAFAFSAISADILLARFEHTWSRAEMILGDHPHNRLISDIAIGKTRVGHYLDARRLLDAEISRGLTALLPARAEVGWTKPSKKLKKG